MKIKHITIGIKTVKEGLNEFKEAYKKTLLRKKAEKKEGLFFESVTALRSFLTPKRVELLRTIHRENPRSAYALAKLVHRDVKSVVTDLSILKSFGLLVLEEEENHIRPWVDYDALRVEIAV